MKKYLLGLAVLMMGTVVMTSCGDDDDPAPTEVKSWYATGAYIVNSGNLYNNIESSLTGIDYATSTATQGVFKAANGRSLGNTANDGIIYGDKMYLAVDQSNTIEVLDKYTKKSIKQVSTTALLGDKDGQEPRHIIANSGNVYFTTYGGYVAAIDTTSFALQAKYQVGNYPEGLAIGGNQLYVANSNYGQGGGNLSCIDLETGKVTTKNIEGINNPTSVYDVYGALYVLDQQYYDASYVAYGENALKLVDWANGTSSKIVEGNYAALYMVQSDPTTRMSLAYPDSYFYVVNAPYTGEAPTYSCYNVLTRQTTTLNLSEAPFSPAGIGVDPIAGYVFILSYNKGDGGYADYNGDGYVLQYQNNGTLLGKYNVGVGPCAIFFDAAVRTDFRDY